jgi:sterol desaturase/sphingolipid hydroxylase (fatty acid hydroxylase superfamily)
MALTAAIAEDPFLELDARRLEAFRTEYRGRFAGKRYDGRLHAATVFAIGATALALMARFLRKPTAAEAAVVPATFLACNLAEWALHAFVMHTPRKGALGIYQRHTLNHHQFFSRDRMTYESVDDYRIVFFPPAAIATLLVLSAGPAAALGSATRSRNAGLLLAMTTTGMYLVYETFHYCSHQPDSWLMRNLPFVNTIRRHHAAHHDKRMMKERNMNLTFPIADWLFGTSDLDRGLFGHLFNGMDETHVKPEYRPAGLAARQRR